MVCDNKSDADIVGVSADMGRRAFHHLLLRSQPIAKKKAKK